jgi:hypothetical protein
LVVIDGGGLRSTQAEVSVSSGNLAPTAHAGPDQIVALFQTVSLDGGGSTDPDGDALQYAWSLTTKPGGSASLLNGSSAATPYFQPDVPGSYTVALTVSDPYGAGIPDTVDIVVLDGASYAAQQLLQANSTLMSIPLTQITTPGNRTALSGLLAQAGRSLNRSDYKAALQKLEQAIERTDGCRRTGQPDGNGPGRDWVTSCAAQAELIARLEAARQAIAR